MISSPHHQLSKDNKFYQLQARINKCYINCQKDKMTYGVCLRFGSKISEETAKKHPINYTMIDFNSKVSLTLSKNELVNSYKCEILLLKFSWFQQQQKKQIIGISSIHITDLKQESFRKFRLINNYDKCAIIQASIKLVQIDNHYNKISQHSQLSKTSANMSQQEKKIYRQNRKIIRHNQASSFLQFKEVASQQLKYRKVLNNETAKINNQENARFQRSSSKSSNRSQKMINSQNKWSDFDQTKNQCNLYHGQKYVMVSDSISPISSFCQNGFDMNLTKKHSKEFQMSQARSQKTLQQKDNQKFYKTSQNFIQNQKSQGNKFSTKYTKNVNNQNDLQGISQSIRYHSRKKLTSSQIENQCQYNNVPISIKSTFQKQVQTLKQDIFEKYQNLKTENQKNQFQKKQLNQQITILKNENLGFRQLINKEKINKNSFRNNESQTYESEQKLAKEKAKIKKLSVFHLPQLFINYQSDRYLRIWSQTTKISLLLKSNKVFSQNCTNTTDKKHVQKQVNTVNILLSQKGSNTNRKQLNFQSSFKFDIDQKYPKTNNNKNQEININTYKVLIQKLQSERQEWLKANANLKQEKQKLQCLLKQSNNIDKMKQLKLDVFKLQHISIQDNQKEIKKKKNYGQNQVQVSCGRLLCNQSQNTFKLEQKASKIEKNKESCNSITQSVLIQDYFKRGQTSRITKFGLQRIISICLKPKRKVTMVSTKKEIQSKIQITKDQNSFSKYKMVGYVSSNQKKNSQQHQESTAYKPRNVYFKEDMIEEMPNQSALSPNIEASLKTSNFNFLQMIKPVQQDNSTFNIVTHEINGKTQEASYDIFDQQCQQQSQIINESIVISINSIKQQSQQNQEDKKQAKWSFVEYRKLNDQNEAQKFYRQNREYNVKQLQLYQRGKNIQQRGNEIFLQEYRKIKMELRDLNKQIQQRKYISSEECQQIQANNIKLNEDIKRVFEDNKSLNEKNINLTNEISRINDDFQKLIKKNQHDLSVIKEMKRELFNFYDKQSQAKKNSTSHELQIIPFQGSYHSVPYGSVISPQNRNVKRKDSLKSDYSCTKKISQKSLLNGFLGNFQKKEGRGMFRKQSINLKDSGINSLYKNTINHDKMPSHKQKDHISQKSIQSKPKSNNSLFIIQKQFKSQIIGPKKGFKLQKKSESNSQSKIETSINSFTFQNSFHKISKDNSRQQAQIQVEGFQILDFMSDLKN